MKVDLDVTGAVNEPTWQPSPSLAEQIAANRRNELALLTFCAGMMVGAMLGFFLWWLS